MSYYGSKMGHFMLSLNTLLGWIVFLKNNLFLIVQSRLDTLDFGHPVLLFRQHKKERYCPKVAERYKGIVMS